MLTTKLRKNGLIKILTILSAITVPLLNIQQAANADNASSQVTVTVPTLNVRESADISSKIISRVHQGDTFEIIQKRNDWDQIKLVNNKTGWVHDSYITPADKTVGTINTFSLNVRERPSVSSSVVGYLKSGTKITIHLEQAGWAKIVSPSGLSGWVNERYITKDKPSNQHTQPAAPTAKKRSGQTTELKVAKASDAPMTTPSTKTEPMPNNQKPLKGKTIVLDPGHGGKDKGTTSIAGTPEKSLNLPTVEVVKLKLEDAGAQVILTRTNDMYIPLEQRANVANQNHADAFISFHYNWSNNPSVNGITDFYYQKSSNSLAAAILNQVAKETKLTNLGTRFNNLGVLRNNKQPATLIELGFLSNQQDDSIVESPHFRNNVAEGIYLGLLDYFQSK
ncbi:N-acetylmuramoyl-L-alanine amidase [Neobacillus bataviensis]|uniref:N-acetylmuramoyl-L-alanine amidase n=1 Tax=Neobacillus bataviensis TaxID=220685 RepID=A0A561CGB3_9BACI|nr:N-acetylmuramoyl-L-alanine amidase [Neobacillus bataviensis]TWD90184.1 N-acetylmuramoyl-L-alanine amidase [Neobacillus bataviensis]